jgi:hypothetical protein
MDSNSPEGAKEEVFEPILEELEAGGIFPLPRSSYIPRACSW